MAMTSYVIALGSNRPGRAGPPRRVLAAAIAALPGVVTASPVIESAPVGPSIRRYANAVVILTTPLAPSDLLASLKSVEASFGRRGGRRWGARVLDLDIILWSGGIWSAPGLAVPHPAFRERDFVLGPLRFIAPDWRDPVSGLAVRHLRARLTRSRRAPR